MSTNDVPGANPANGDELKMGCWAEHGDGSMIFIEGTEGGYVIYSVFDMEPDTPIEYRDRMAEKSFKNQFTKKGWTWHDKKPFPWDRVINKGAKPGPRHPSAEQQLNAAQQVAKSRDLKGGEIQSEDLEHMEPRERISRAIDDISSAIRKYLNP